MLNKLILSSSLVAATLLPAGSALVAAPACRQLTWSNQFPGKSFGETTTTVQCVGDQLLVTDESTYTEWNTHEAPRHTVTILDTAKKLATSSGSFNATYDGNAQDAEQVAGYIRTIRGMIGSLKTSVIPHGAELDAARDADVALLGAMIPTQTFQWNVHSDGKSTSWTYLTVELRSDETLQVTATKDFQQYNVGNGTSTITLDSLSKIATMKASTPVVNGPNVETAATYDCNTKDALQVEAYKSIINQISVLLNTVTPSHNPDELKDLRQDAAARLWRASVYAY